MRTSITHPELFSTVFESSTKSRLHRTITGVATDSREIKNGDLYLAIKGDRFDGHQFLDQALLNGAVAALVGLSWQRPSSPRPGVGTAAPVVDGIQPRSFWLAP